MNIGDSVKVITSIHFKDMIGVIVGMNKKTITVDFGVDKSRIGVYSIQNNRFEKKSMNA